VVAELDLAALRAERLRRWHLAGNPLAGVDEAVAFLKHTGFCLSHRTRSFLLASFVEAIAGSKRGVPAYADAAGHPLYRRYVELRHHSRVNRLVLEAPVIQRRHTLLLREHVVDLARLHADPPLADRRSSESRAAAEWVLATVADQGPQSKRALREAMRRRPARTASGLLDRVLLDLESRLRLLTVDYREKDGAIFDLFARAQRSLALRAARQSRAESVDHLSLRHVRSAIVVEAKRVGGVLRGIASTEEVRASLARLAERGEISRVRASDGEWLVVGQA
jgi:hypothetical protein